MAEEFCSRQSPSLASFVHHLKELTVQEIREGEAALSGAASGAVALLNGPLASKGLEFPVVFLPDMAARTNAGRAEALTLHP